MILTSSNFAMGGEFMIMVVSFPPKRFQILATISYDLQWQLYNLYIEAL